MVGSPSTQTLSQACRFAPIGWDGVLFHSITWYDPTVAASFWHQNKLNAKVTRVEIFLWTLIFANNLVTLNVMFLICQLNVNENENKTVKALNDFALLHKTKIGHNNNKSVRHLTPLVTTINELPLSKFLFWMFHLKKSQDDYLIKLSLFSKLLFSTKVDRRLKWVKPFLIRIFFFLALRSPLNIFYLPHPPVTFFKFMDGTKMA